MHNKNFWKKFQIFSADTRIISHYWCYVYWNHCRNRCLCGVLLYWEI